MKLKPKFFQFDCVEGNKVDARQAKAVLRHKPDIVIFEKPAGKSGPSMVFNSYFAKTNHLKKLMKLSKV